MRGTLGVACALCIVFQLMFILYMLFASYRLILFVIHSFMRFLTVRSAENKLQECKSNYYKARVYTSPKKQNPFGNKENKLRENK